MHRWSAPLTVLLLLAGCPSASVAQTRDQQWAWCADESNRNLQIDGCTAIIQSDQESAANLTIALNNRGVAYGSKAWHDRAIRDFDHAIQLDPNDIKAIYNRGISHFDNGQYDLAIQDFGQAIRLNPNYANAFYNRGIALRALGQLARAAEDLAKARELNPRLPPLPR